MESWFLDGKTPNSAKMVLISFLAHSLQIGYSKGKKSGKKHFFLSIKMQGIRVFWHAEFISALKTELNPTVFEKNQKIK